jgi:hypothetical protein
VAERAGRDLERMPPQALIQALFVPSKLSILCLLLPARPFPPAQPPSSPPLPPSPPRPGGTSCRPKAALGPSVSSSRLSTSSHCAAAARCHGSVRLDLAASPEYSAAAAAAEAGRGCVAWARVAKSGETIEACLPTLAGGMAAASPSAQRPSGWAGRGRGLRCAKLTVLHTPACRRTGASVRSSRHARTCAESPPSPLPPRLLRRQRGARCGETWGD